jgi:hypothetical protein
MQTDMKNLLTLLSIAFFTISTIQARILTVNNNNTTAGQYNNLQTAVDAAVSGDTLLIHGSNTNYGNCTLPANKALTLRGPGWNPAYKQAGLPATITILYFAPRAGNITLEGLYINTGISMQSVNEDGRTIYHQSGVKIQLCRIASLSLAKGCSNFILQNNYFQAFYGGSDTTSNMIIRYNIFNQFRDFVNTSNILIDHNLFVGGQFSNINDCTVSNNIFHNCYVASGINRCAISNNLTYHVYYPTYTIFYNSTNGAEQNTFIGNIINADPKFVYGNNLTDVFVDYHLQSSSPAKGTGLGGKDIGIYTDEFTFSKTGEPSPVIRTLQIANPTVPMNGNLTVKMTASKARTDKD